MEKNPAKNTTPCKRKTANGYGHIVKSCEEFRTEMDVILSIHRTIIYCRDRIVERKILDDMMKGCRI